MESLLKIFISIDTCKQGNIRVFMRCSRCLDWLIIDQHQLEYFTNKYWVLRLYFKQSFLWVYFTIFVAFLLFLTLMITNFIWSKLDLSYHSHILTSFHSQCHPIILKCWYISAFLCVLTISQNISMKPYST